MPEVPALSPSIAVRRLQLREELDRSSCGNVLFNGYLPPPGVNSQWMEGREGGLKTTFPTSLALGCPFCYPLDMMGFVILCQMLGLMLGKEIGSNIFLKTMGQLVILETQKRVLEPDGCCSPGLISLWEALKELGSFA